MSITREDYEAMQFLPLPASSVEWSLLPFSVFLPGPPDLERNKRIEAWLSAYLETGRLRIPPRVPR